MSDQNVRNAAPDAPASIDEIEIEPLSEESLEGVAGGCSAYHCSVPGEDHTLRPQDPNA